MRRTSWMFLIVATCVATLMITPCANAALTVANGNSSVTVDPLSQAGMNNWTVDGVNQMYQQWFWYRIGATGPQSAINTISAPTVATAAGRIIDTGYSNSSLSVDILYTLTGGTAGSNTSDVAETIRIINNTASAFTIHFFQYSDFDLNGTPAGQTATFISPNAFQQTGPAGGAVMTETVTTPAPNTHEAGLYPNTLNSLNSVPSYTLNGTNSATGDATWAFGWDQTIAAGGTFIISKDKNIRAAVPEPASMMMLGGVMLLISRKLRKVTA
jgi:hypothetical protein